MKKFFLLLLSLSACVAQVDSQPSNQESGKQNVSSDSIWGYSNEGQEPGCDSYEQIVVEPDGSRRVVNVPALCAPYYLDTGDPALGNNPGEEMIFNIEDAVNQ